MELSGRDLHRYGMLTGRIWYVREGEVIRNRIRNTRESDGIK